MKKGLAHYRNGNYDVFLFEDGTKIRYTEEDEFEPEFAENIDVKLTDRCSGTNCQFCHEGSGPEGKQGDLNLPFFDTLRPGTEVACGGGDVLEHPGFDAFLERMKKQGVVCNMTVNQIHFLQSRDRIKHLIDSDLIKGLGLSLVVPTDSFIAKAKEFENAVVHVIAGLFSESDFNKLKGNGLKLLILGYKDFRRGHSYKEKFREGIDKNIEWLSNHLAEVTGGFEIISFDNLALEQLDVKSKVSKDYWERHYMGDDGKFTFYVDCVRKEFARDSTEPLEKRKPIMDDATEMFQAVLAANRQGEKA